jgi:two-component system phosphate regulon sensor histidine kinase PhoR
VSKISPSTLRLFYEFLPWKFLKKLVFQQLLLTSFVIVITAFASRYYLKSYILQQAKYQQQSSLELIRSTLSLENVDPLTWCQSFKLSWTSRYSLIDQKGIVLCDNYVDITHMDNHATRPEIKDAMDTGMGSSVRYSDSYGHEMVYGAVRFTSAFYPGQKLVIRQAVPLTKVDMAVASLDQNILLFLIPIIILTSILSLWNSLTLVMPMRSVLRKIDLMRRTGFGVENKSEQIENNDEWTLVESTLDQAKFNTENYLKSLDRENEKFQTLIGSINDAILAVDRNYSVLFVNSPFRDFFIPLANQNEDQSQKKYWEYIRDPDLKEIFTQVFESKKAISKLNFPLKIVETNETNYFDITVSPLIDKRRKIFGTVCVFHDVTARKLTEQMRENFVTNVSHEVRTPLTALKGYVQTIKNMIPADDKMSNYLNRIESNSDRLTVLFDDILNLSVIESEEKMDKVLYSTKELTENVLCNVKQSYPGHNLTILNEFELEKVWCNPQFLDQVLTNLVDNAFKYSNAEGGTIYIRWKEQQDTHVIEVEDDGIGIDKVHHTRLFERFYRVDPSRNSKIKGSGLGLSIVKHIVQKHDGKINVATSAAGGTLFTIHLPKPPVS